MSGTPLDRLTTATGVASYVVVGLAAGLVGSASPWWWVVYAAGLVIFVALCQERVGLVLARVLLGGLFVTALLTYLLAADFALSAVPMVTFIATVGFILPWWETLSLVGIQSGVLIAVSLLRSDGAKFGIAVAVMYAVFQLFALLMVETSSRERRMREELGAANTELALAQSRLAESSKVEERLRISRDLHDLVGHQLSALAVNLEVASHLAEGSAAESVTRSRSIAKDLLIDVRHVVGQLREPPVPLREALQDMADAVPSPLVRLNLPEDLAALSDDESEIVLRCVQEIITNAMRHADAEHLWVAISSSGRELVLTARDDGHGSGDVAAGHGLTGMQERVSRLGGQVSWEGGDGFRVEARLRLAA